MTNQQRQDQSTSTPTSTPNSDAADTSSGWGQLFSGGLLAPMIVMAGGILLYAMNLYFTAALMPTVVNDIGGAEYFAWAATAYLITAVTATMLAGRLFGTWGVGLSYITAFVLFGIGTAVCALSNAMPLFIGGRAIQGFGAGLLAALGYATIRHMLPEHLWTRATGVITAMFAIGALVGPGLGGAFGEAGTWRPAFWTLLITAAILIIMVLVALPRSRPSTPDRTPIPAPSIVILAATATLLSVSQMATGGWEWAMMAASLALLVVFFIVDARSASGVLPHATYQRGKPLKWVYLTITAISAAVLSEYFIPDFGQKLAHLGPLLAGFLGAIMSLGWAVAQLFSINARPQSTRTLIRLGLVVMAVGITGFGLLLVDNASPTRVIIWALLLLLAGIGVGLAFPHLSVLAMRSSTDPVEGGKAAAAISTTQLISFTLTSAIAGNLLTFGDTPLASARWVILGIAVITVLGIIAAAAATRRYRDTPQHSQA